MWEKKYFNFRKTANVLSTFAQRMLIFIREIRFFSCLKFWNSEKMQKHFLFVHELVVYGISVFWFEKCHSFVAKLFGMLTNRRTWFAFFMSQLVNCEQLQTDFVRISCMNHEFSDFSNRTMSFKVEIFLTFLDIWLRLQNKSFWKQDINTSWTFWFVAF